MPDLEIEKRLLAALSGALGADEGGRLGRRYEHARFKMFRDVLPYIPAAEPNLTDHSSRHIEHVLSNACRLIEDEEIHALDLYLLCLSILFHDAGNVRGRRDHHKRVGEAYDYAFPASEKDPQERRLITIIAAAHTGTAADGSTDTLRELGQTDQYSGNVVHPQAIAATLRFADELAEGPERTSTFAIEHQLFDHISRKFHVYANATRVTIDKRNSRIALDHYIDTRESSGDLEVSERVSLPELLSFVYRRIMKLDNERKYTNHYCEWLAVFKTIEVNLHLTCNEYTVTVKSLRIQMSDLTLPDETDMTLESRFPELVIPEVEAEVRRRLNRDSSDA